MKFVCTNTHCADCGVPFEYSRNTYRMIDGRLVSNNAACPKCGELRKEVNDGDVDLRSMNIGRYSGSSMEDKREILKKRSHDHFNKEIKEYKENQLHEAMNQFKNLK